MRAEAFRMERVTYTENGVSRLFDCNLNLFAGEIMGMLPLNGQGLPALLDVMQNNLPLEYGFVFYREKMINNWHKPHPRHNPIGFILNKSQLVEGLTVSDNIFVLRSGFRAWYIRNALLRTQLAPFFTKIGVDIPLNAYVEDLTPFQRVVVELVRSIVAGYRLIVLYDISTTLSEGELSELHRILRRYAAEGISFLYIGFQTEEVGSISDRVALFGNGRIVKIVEKGEPLQPILEHAHDSKASIQQAPYRQSHASPVFEAVDLSTDGSAKWSFSVYPGECVILHDAQNRLTDGLISILLRDAVPKSGRLLLDGRPLSMQAKRNFAIVHESPSVSMLFPQLSYFDNLFFVADHHLPRLWRDPRMQRRLAKEHAARSGIDLFGRSIDSLSELEKYDLIYHRILLQKPKIVFCVRPFKGADMELREHIHQLFSKLRQKQIAVLILTINASDELPIADRIIPIP